MNHYTGIMKRWVAGVALVTGGFTIAGCASEEGVARVHRFVNRPDGTAIAETAEAPVLESTEFQGRLFQGWSNHAIQAAGFECLTFVVAPDAEFFPVHEGDDAWFGYVLRGSVESVLTDKDKANRSTVRLQAGDYLFFDPKTMHGWKACGEEVELMFLRAVPASLNP